MDGRAQINMQFGHNKISFFQFKLPPANLLIILYQLTKFEAPGCNSFWDLLITNFNSDPLKGALLHKGDNSS